MVSGKVLLQDTAHLEYAGQERYPVEDILAHAYLGQKRFRLNLEPSEHK